jgi:hypothetical protein
MSGLASLEGLSRSYEASPPDELDYLAPRSNTLCRSARSSLCMAAGVLLMRTCERSEAGRGRGAPQEVDHTNPRILNSHRLAENP